MFRPVYHFRQESRQIVNCVSEFQNMEMESFSTQETLIRTSKCFELSLCFSDCFVATATLSKQKILTRRIPQYYYQPRIKEFSSTGEQSDEMLIFQLSSCGLSFSKVIKIPLLNLNNKS